MDFRKLAAGAAGALTLFSAGAADAALIFKGSWRVTDGLAGDTTPRSAQEAAAKLFGGSASDYTISTAGKNVGDIDFQAHYVLFGLGEGVTSVTDQDAKDIAGFDISAYAFDQKLADKVAAALLLDPPEQLYMNYAFIEADTTGHIPEPATWALLIGGFGATGVALRRRRALAA